MNPTSVTAVCFDANEIAEGLSLPLATGVLLRAARHDERVLIDKKIERLAPSTLSPIPHGLLGSFQPKSSGWQFTPCPPPRAYVLLEAPSWEIERRHVSLLLIAERPLHFGFSVMNSVESGHSTMHDSEYLFQLLNSTAVPGENLKQIERKHGESYLALAKFTSAWDDQSWVRPHATFEQYRQALRVSPTSPFRFLALCAIVEGLLVRKPKSSDSTESVGRQIKRKVPLLNRRNSAPVIASHYFASSDNIQDGDLLWNALYDLRSEIAHGDSASFVKGEGRKKVNLIDLNSCVNYVDATCRMLLRQMCEEPELLADLRGV